MKIGFTGTQRGITRQQINQLLQIFEDERPDEFHHGDCIGADADAHGVMREVSKLVNFKCKIVGHPPLLNKKRAFTQCDEWRTPAPYLDRNHAIVNETDCLIACPFTREEQQRSGTWATIRFARKVEKPIRIIYPSGYVRREY